VRAANCARYKPDRFYFSKSKNEIRARALQEKVVQLVVGENGQTEYQGLASELINVPSLNDAQVYALAEIGQRIEDFFQAPQDIEWARVEDEIFVLQARPIGIRNA
jgi:pyruvate,water dikinase